MNSLRSLCASLVLLMLVSLASPGQACPNDSESDSGEAYLRTVARGVRDYPQRHPIRMRYLKTATAVISLVLLFAYLERRTK